MAEPLPKYRALHARLVETKGRVASLDDVITAIESSIEDIAAWSKAVDAARTELDEYAPGDNRSEGDDWHDPRWSAFYESRFDEYSGDDDRLEAAYEKSPAGKAYAAALAKESKGVEVAQRVLDGASEARQLTDDGLADEDGIPLKATLAQLKKAKRAFETLASKLPALVGEYKP